MDAEPRARPAPAPGGLGRRGRPRRAAVDAAIIRAAVEVITEVGVQRTSLTAVADRAGVARATVYLRWPTRSALIGAAARAAVGGQPLQLSGRVEDDIRSASLFIQRIFENPPIRAMLPEIIRGVLAEPPEIDFHAVAPRRTEFGRGFRERAASEGFDATLDPHLAFDMLLGAAIVHLLANLRPMTEEQSRRLGDVVVAGLRARSAPTGDLEA
jgi:AcrR family transcriptional regulator